MRRCLFSTGVALALFSGCLLWPAQGAQAIAALCPNAPVERWYSPVANNLADKAPQQCQTCAHPDNVLNDSCIVYRLLQSDTCRAGRCINDQGEFRLDQQSATAVQRSVRHEHPWRFVFDIGSNCWFLLWALDPVIGAEHVESRDAVNFWQKGYLAAKRQIHPAIEDSELGMLIQPAQRRSQHQLHIHIGRIQTIYRERLDQLEPVADIVYQVNLPGYRFFVRYLPDLPGHAPLEGYAIFEKVVQMLPDGESMMPLYGVLLARDSVAAGSWLMAAEGLMRSELVLAWPEACRFSDDEFKMNQLKPQ